MGWLRWKGQRAACRLRRSRAFGRRSAVIDCAGGCITNELKLFSPRSALPLQRKRLSTRGDLPQTGAVVDFPMVVNVPSVGRRHTHPWSMTVSHEPGTPFPEGVTSVKIPGPDRPLCHGRGCSQCASATLPPFPARLRRSGAGRASNSSSLPHRSRSLRSGGRRSAMNLRRESPNAMRARGELIAFTRPVLVRLARSVRTGMREAGAVGVEDLVQEA